jgi:hypothetical protein
MLHQKPSAVQNMKFLLFFYFCRSICPPGSGSGRSKSMRTVSMHGIPIRIHDPQDQNTGYLRDKIADPVERPTLSMKGITVSRSCSVILLDTESFINMLSISVTPTAYISDSRLEQAIRPEEWTCLKGQCHDNVVDSFPDP